VGQQAAALAHPGEHGPRHQVGLGPRQPALVGLRIPPVDGDGDGRAEHRIAEELHAFVGAAAAILRRGLGAQAAGVRTALQQQIGIGEAMAQDALGELQAGLGADRVVHAGGL